MERCLSVLWAFSILFVIYWQREWKGKEGWKEDLKGRAIRREWVKVGVGCKMNECGSCLRITANGVKTSCPSNLLTLQRPTCVGRRVRPLCLICYCLHSLTTDLSVCLQLPSFGPREDTLRVVKVKCFCDLCDEKVVQMGCTLSHIHSLLSLFPSHPLMRPIIFFELCPTTDLFIFLSVHFYFSPLLPVFLAKTISSEKRALYLSLGQFFILIPLFFQSSSLFQFPPTRYWKVHPFIYVISSRKERKKEGKKTYSGVDRQLIKTIKRAMTIITLWTLFPLFLSLNNHERNE